MAASTFGDALARVLAHEGGYTNNPDDPGGPTNFGITIGDYRRYVKPNATAADVRAMQVGDAKTIYRARYWDAIRCDELPAGIDYAVFDYGVNSGVARASKVLQRLLGLPAGDRVGDVTVAAARNADASRLIAQLCDERLAFLKQLKTWPTFGAGWGRRVADVKTAALAMAAKSPRQASGSRVDARPSRRPFQAAVAGFLAVAGAAAIHLASLFTTEINMNIFVPVLTGIAGGYVISVFTWPRLRQAMVGIETEIDDLRAKARALETALRS